MFSGVHFRLLGALYQGLCRLEEERLLAMKDSRFRRLIVGLFSWGSLCVCAYGVQEPYPRPFTCGSCSRRRGRSRSYPLGRQCYRHAVSRTLRRIDGHGCYRCLQRRYHPLPRSNMSGMLFYIKWGSRRSYFGRGGLVLLFVSSVLFCYVSSTVPPTPSSARTSSIQGAT